MYGLKAVELLYEQYNEPYENLRYGKENFRGETIRNRLQRTGERPKRETR